MTVLEASSTEMSSLSSLIKWSLSFDSAYCHLSLFLPAQRIRYISSALGVFYCSSVSLREGNYCSQCSQLDTAREKKWSGLPQTKCKIEDTLKKNNMELTWY